MEDLAFIDKCSKLLLLLCMKNSELCMWITIFHKDAKSYVLVLCNTSNVYSLLSFTTCCKTQLSYHMRFHFPSLKAWNSSVNHFLSNSLHHLNLILSFLPYIMSFFFQFDRTTLNLTLSVVTLNLLHKILKKISLQFGL